MVATLLCREFCIRLARDEVSEDGCLALEFARLVGPCQDIVLLVHRVAPVVIDWLEVVLEQIDSVQCFEHMRLGEINGEGRKSKIHLCQDDLLYVHGSDVLTSRR